MGCEVIKIHYQGDLDLEMDISHNSSQQEDAIADNLRNWLMNPFSSRGHAIPMQVPFHESILAYWCFETGVLRGFWTQCHLQLDPAFLLQWKTRLPLSSFPRSIQVLPQGLPINGLYLCKFYLSSSYVSTHLVSRLSTAFMSGNLDMR